MKYAACLVFIDGSLHRPGILHEESRVRTELLSVILIFGGGVTFLAVSPYIYCGQDLLIFGIRPVFNVLDLYARFV